MYDDARKQAETFIDKVIAPRRAAPETDEAALKARSKLAKKDVELARRHLTEAGVDVDALDKLAKERSYERKKLAEETRRRAVEASAAAARRLAEIAPVILPIDPVETVIDQVTFIRSFLGQGQVTDSNIGPSDNWAKYRIESSTDHGSGVGRLSFFTLWRNERKSPTTVTARANLTVNGHLSCDAEWMGTASWFGLDSSAQGSVRARTTVWSMDSSVSSIVHDRLLGVAGTTGGFFGDDTSRSIAFSELLPASAVVVPAEAFVLIEVEIVTEWFTDLGSVAFDAKDGSRRVDVPSLVLTEIRSPEPPPPISLSASVDTSTSPATVTFNWSGATTPTVDIFRNGALFRNTANDGVTSVSLNSGTHVFRLCNSGSPGCSADLNVVVP
jgi:hypothetical protein